MRHRGQAKWIDPVVPDLSPEAEPLLNWHISELEALLKRFEPKDFARPTIEGRLIEAYEALVGPA